MKDMKYEVGDVIKTALAWIGVTAASFVYWFAVLMIISIFLVNVWNVTFEEILRYSIILMIITSMVYLVITIRRKIK